MTTSLKERLSQQVPYKLELVLNENRSTMLSILDKTRHSVRLSIHTLFLNAPNEVIAAIAHYIKGTRKQRQYHNLILRSYIQQQLASTDYSHLVKKDKLEQEGNIYHLQKIYDAHNQKYFNNTLDLSITWYHSKVRRPRRQITFGHYVDGLRLIKINRMLDDHFFPEYFVSFVVYHEMLHAVVPGHIDRQGRRFCFHHHLFKEREKECDEYIKATEWEKRNKKNLWNRL